MIDTCLRRGVLAILAAGLFTLAACGAEGPGLRHYYPVPRVEPPQTIEVDVCVYGGTPGGVAAAVQARRMGKSAALVVFRRHVGGMTSGGLTASDLGRAEAIGGLAKEFYKRLGRSSGFRPSEAESLFRKMLEEAGVSVHFEHRLSAVRRQGPRLLELECENGNRFRAKMFVDATYEGDLLARAGVSFHVGREANREFGETINGVQFRDQHNFDVAVDPYRTPGQPQSGLLWGISADDPGQPGQADRRIQAYNFRMFLSNAANRSPFPKPADYDRTRYALLARYLKLRPVLPFQLQNGDCNNRGGFSTDHIGANYAWPEGDYATREKIFQDHVQYQQGLLHFMAEDPDVPAELQAAVKKFGLHAGEFPETDGWPHELYVREGRRMRSDFVMTERHCRSQPAAEESVGLASYTMDSHNCQRVVIGGRVRNEGDVQIGVPKPYPVSYRAIVPKAAECENLLVPVCLSATHIAYGSIRMEPVFMILGQSSGTAAALAIDGGHSVQETPYARLHERLLADGQILEWTGPAASVTPAVGIDPATVAGIVVDNRAAKLVGDWSAGRTVAPFLGQDYLHDANEQQGKKSASFTPKLPRDGQYDVELLSSTHANRATRVVVEVTHAGGTERVLVNQRARGGWQRLFRGRFLAGEAAQVTIRNDDADGFVIADAVRWIEVKD